jgi:hypothetical protein
MHIAGVTPVAAYRNAVLECCFRTPVAGNGLIPSSVTSGGGVSNVYPPTHSGLNHPEPS